MVRSARLVAICLAAMMVAPSLARAMTFEKVPTGRCAQRQCVLASGIIDGASLESFRAFVRDNRYVEGAIVFISSPGGDHVAGIALGREIRKRGFNTFVANYDARTASFLDTDCASACVYAFVGGVQRGASERSRLGVHQVTLTKPGSVSQGVTGAQWFMGLAAEHILDMGADPRLMSLALKTPSAGMRWLSRQDMLGARAINVDSTLQPPGGGLGALSFFDATK